ncbi:MAG: hypothetical protein ABI570_05380 [Ilumatobacteraceae bacterium]
MVFIVRYQRSKALLLSLEQFDENDNEAIEVFINAEQVNTDDDIEIVLISTDSEKSLRKSYWRYFVNESKAKKASAV